MPGLALTVPVCVLVAPPMRMPGWLLRCLLAVGPRSVVVRMPIRPVGMQMGVAAVFLGTVQVEPVGRPEAPDSERHEHGADAKLRPDLGAGRDAEPAPCQSATRDKHVHRVAYTPADPEQGRLPGPRSLTDKHGHGDHVVHFQSV
jgi:hypothetical protein